VLQAGDIAAISGPRDALVEQVEKLLPEVNDRERSTRRPPCSTCS
jgi:hypothetical protein